MALEVREFLIRALVDPTRAKDHASAKSLNNISDSPSNSWDYHKSLTDEFSRMLKKKKER